ncbi:hypothetical protein CEE37_07065 [candidate division LCP-89 bacterium B3_LCP]|uniref:ATPase n=1 Tax=candidate division LCP-89 bacterium B3_LCP TaxID=2012998 RepID=A0A532V0L9_UNCL8|nr:MAG: hypothetical protein CEE37_07065 [candidate division LCP-89 bacterium B3_LCP]
MEKQSHKIPHIEDIPKPDADFVGSEEGAATHKDKDAIKIDFRVKPEELETYLSKYIVDQEEAVEVLATKICTHFNRMRLEIEEEVTSDVALGNIKSNILMIGPTGVGKTYIIKLIADRIGVPFVKGDATKFSETGYIGGDVENLVRDLVHEAEGNIPLAEYGIIYIDEIDKIASAPNAWGPDVSRSGVQRNLLKLMEETEVDMKVPHDLASQMEAVVEAQRTGKATRKKVNTRNILFVVSGAFDGLIERIGKRISQQGMGFKSDVGLTSGEKTELLKQVATRDLIDYGFESEFIGRLPVTVTLNELNEESLYTILKNENCAVIQTKKREFRAYGIKLDFKDEALRLLAQQAALEKTGARGLLSAIERVLIKFEKKLPTVEVKDLLVTKELIEKPEKTLKEIVFEHILSKHSNTFKEQTGIELTYHRDARKKLSTIYDREGSGLDSHLQEALKDYFYGVKLMGISRLVVTRDVLNDPKGTLDRLIKEAYDKKAD